MSEPMFNLRVLLRYDDQYGVYVGHCLETGNVVTANDMDQTREMIKELLEDELAFALKNDNLKNLFSSPAPLEIVIKWLNAAADKDPDRIPLNINLDDVPPLTIKPKNQNLKPEVSFARAAA